MAALALVRAERATACHPDRPRYALGHCQACYWASRSTRPIATCHEMRFAYRDGLCRECWGNRGRPTDTPMLSGGLLGVQVMRVPTRVARCPKCMGSGILERPATRFEPGELSCQNCGWNSYLMSR